MAVAVVAYCTVLNLAFATPKFDVGPTVPPVSRLWSCQSGESNLRARISGDVPAGIRLRPVNNMHLAKKKGSLRCAFKLLFREFMKTGKNILQKTSSRKPSPLKITIWAFLDVPDTFPEVILDFY